MAAARSTSRSRRSAAERIEPVHDRTSTLGALLVGDAQEDGGVGVTVRRRDEDVVERGEPARDLGVHRHPPVEERCGVGALQHAPHLGSVPDGDRFVVAGQRPVEREFEHRRLAADRREHRLAADAGPFGDGVDRRRPVAAFGEELRSRVDDPPPGRSCCSSRSADRYGRGSAVTRDHATTRRHLTTLVVWS